MKILLFLLIYGLHSTFCLPPQSHLSSIRLRYQKIYKNQKPHSGKFGSVVFDNEFAYKQTLITFKKKLLLLIEAKTHHPFLALPLALEGDTFYKQFFQDLFMDIYDIAHIYTISPRIKGVTLAELLFEKNLTFIQKKSLSLCIFLAVEHLGSIGYFHQDLHTKNIIVTPYYEAVLIDFDIISSSPNPRSTLLLSLTLQAIFTSNPYLITRYGKVVHPLTYYNYNTQSYLNSDTFPEELISHRNQYIEGMSYKDEFLSVITAMIKDPLFEDHLNALKSLLPFQQRERLSLPPLSTSILLSC